MMLELDQIHQMIEQVLSCSQADQTEVIILHEESALTRFARSRIHQNVCEWNTQVRVRAIVDQRIGTAATNDLSQAGLAKVTQCAWQMAQLSPRNTDFKSLPGPQPIPTTPGFVEATASFTPQQRADSVASICTLANTQGLTASGQFSITARQIAVGNSCGVFACAPSTISDLSTVILSEDSSGYSGDTAMDVGAIDPERIGGEAVQRALSSHNPQGIAPGEYPVLLEPYAVAEIVSNLSTLGFGALAYQDGYSFMSNRLGQQITGKEISIWDDGHDARGLVMPFDYEGLPKQRLDLIRDGIAAGVVYDSLMATKVGRQSTGHAQLTPALYIQGPQAGNLFMQPGEAHREELLSILNRGVLVTRFHYVSPVDPLQTVFTGMTRDGTFWIENGRIQRPLRNLRFTQSFLQAFERVRAISADTLLRQDTFGAVRVPAVILEKFNFSGVGEF